MTPKVTKKSKENGNVCDNCEFLKKKILQLSESKKKIPRTPEQVEEQKAKSNERKVKIQQDKNEVTTLKKLNVELQKQLLKINVDFDSDIEKV